MCLFVDKRLVGRWEKVLHSGLTVTGLNACTVDVLWNLIVLADVAQSIPQTECIKLYREFVC